MMKTSLKSATRTGMIFGLVFIFLTLIGFIVVGANMFGGLFVKSAENQNSVRVDAVNLLVFISLFGLLSGVVFQKRQPDAKWMHVVLGGLFTGLVIGLIAGGAVFLIGILHVKGIDLRNYLPNLGPDTIKFALFHSTPLSAAQTYLIFFIIFSLAGALLIKVISLGDGLKSVFDQVKARAAEQVDSQQLRDLMKNKFFLVGVGLLVAVLLYFLPLMWGSYWNYIMGTVAIYILLGLGLNIIVGYSGQLVLGYVAFFATGAYTFALLTAPYPHAIGLNPWLAALLSVVVSVLTGLLIGLPILNLRGDYLAIVTLGFGEIVRILVRSDLMTPFTNGPNGITNVGQPSWLGDVFSDVNYMHFLMLIVLLGLFVAKRLKDSRTGRAWIAIREDQTVAQATGVNTFQYKILALLIGAAFAGLSGALFASRNQFIGPEDFTLMVSINVLCIVIVGGMGSLPGVVAGAFVLKGLPELLRELSDYRLLAFGALLVVMMIVRPNGLLPDRTTWFSRPVPGKDQKNYDEVNQ